MTVGGKIARGDVVQTFPLLWELERFTWSGWRHDVDVADVPLDLTFWREPIYWPTSLIPANWIHIASNNKEDIYSLYGVGIGAHKVQIVSLDNRGYLQEDEVTMFGEFVVHPNLGMNRLIGAYVKECGSLGVNAGEITIAAQIGNFWRIISNIQLTNPCRVTVTNHNYLDDYLVGIGFTSVIELHDRLFRIAVVDANNFDLVGVDATSYHAYTGRGGCRRYKTLGVLPSLHGKAAMAHCTIPMDWHDGRLVSGRATVGPGTNLRRSGIMRLQMRESPSTSFRTLHYSVLSVQAPWMTEATLFPDRIPPGADLKWVIETNEYDDTRYTAEMSFLARPRVETV